MTQDTALPLHSVSMKAISLEMRLTPPLTDIAQTLKQVQESTHHRRRGARNHGASELLPTPSR